MTTVALTWERLGRGRRHPGEAETVAVLDDARDEVFLNILAEQIWSIADRNLNSPEFQVLVVFDDDSTHSGRFTIEGGRFGGGTWQCDDVRSSLTCIGEAT